MILRNGGQLRRTVNGVKPKFRRIAEVYKIFGQQWTGLDWSDQAIIDAYNSDSYGKPTKAQLLINRNGYFIGKQWAGVTVAMWLEDRQRGHLNVAELYNDPTFPHWWLDQVLGNINANK